MYKGTVIHEPGDCETLYFSPSWTPEQTVFQDIFIGVPEDDVVSIVFYRFIPKQSAYCQFWLLPDEIDLLIKGLQDAKERLANNK